MEISAFSPTAKCTKDALSLLDGSYCIAHVLESKADICVYENNCIGFREIIFNARASRTLSEL